MGPIPCYKFGIMRHIVLDTETTGMRAESDDRIVEIGAIELVNYVPTGVVFHHYINPERPIPAEVTAIHGITDAMVANKPIYAQIVDELITFLGDSPLVIHNAEFDMRFLNAEFKRLGFSPLPMTRAIDTLTMARKLFPGAPNSLDALCKRYNVDNSSRTYHGALLDARLLADVYLELVGGRQPDLIGGGRGDTTNLLQTDTDQNAGPVKIWPARSFPLSEADAANHAKLVDGIKDSLWAKAAE